MAWSPWSREAFRMWKPYVLLALPSMVRPAALIILCALQSACCPAGAASCGPDRRQPHSAARHQARLPALGCLIFSPR